MTLYHSKAHEIKPTAPRLVVNLPCVLHIGEQDFPTSTANISYSGVAVLVEDGLDPRLIEAVTLGDAGRLETGFRWRKLGRAGLFFRGRSAARPRLNILFGQLGEYPV